PPAGALGHALVQGQLAARPRLDALSGSAGPCRRPAGKLLADAFPGAALPAAVPDLGQRRALLQPNVAVQFDIHRRKQLFSGLARAPRPLVCRFCRPGSHAEWAGAIARLLGTPGTNHTGMGSSLLGVLAALHRSSEPAPIARGGPALCAGRSQRRLLRCFYHLSGRAVPLLERLAGRLGRTSRMVARATSLALCLHRGDRDLPSGIALRPVAQLARGSVLAAKEGGIQQAPRAALGLCGPVLPSPA